MKLTKTLGLLAASALVAGCSVQNPNSKYNFNGVIGRDSVNSQETFLGNKIEVKKPNGTEMYFTDYNGDSQLDYFDFSAKGFFEGFSRKNQPSGFVIDLAQVKYDKYKIGILKAKGYDATKITQRYKSDSLVLAKKLSEMNQIVNDLR